MNDVHFLRLFWTFIPMLKSARRQQTVVREKEAKQDFENKCKSECL